MKFNVSDQSLLDAKTPCLVTSLKTAKRICKNSGETKTLNQACRDFEDTKGKQIFVQLAGQVERILILGGLEKIEAADYRKAITTASQALVGLSIPSAAIDVTSFKVKGVNTDWLVESAMASLSHSSYQFNQYKSKASKKFQLKSAVFYVDALEKRGLAKTIKCGNALDEGLAFAKDLGNQPPNICNPDYLLSETRRLLKGEKVKVSQLDERKMTSLGMGAFMAVSKGSDAQGRMIIIEYSGGKKGDAPTVLVGKGITFDTGGISLKPPPGMDEMKFDMCGAAAVLGVTRAVISAKLSINLVTIVAAAENMPSGRATRPGDIVTTSSGKTVEILNTDAEGRLVLCDAINYALRYKPKSIVDVATLTGACIVALGSHASALYSNSDKLASDLLEAGENTGDRAWRMPLWDEYQSALNSNFADMANVGGREAGSVTAACFLSRFAENTDWAHLDVAGSAFFSGAKKGSSGRPVPLLFKYLQTR